MSPINGSSNRRDPNELSLEFYFGNKNNKSTRVKSANEQLRVNVRSRFKGKYSGHKKLNVTAGLLGGIIFYRVPVDDEEFIMDHSNRTGFMNDKPVIDYNHSRTLPLGGIELERKMVSQFYFQTGVRYTPVSFYFAYSGIHKKVINQDSALVSYYHAKDIYQFNYLNFPFLIKREIKFKSSRYSIGLFGGPQLFLLLNAKKRSTVYNLIDNTDLKNLLIQNGLPINSEASSLKTNRFNAGCKIGVDFKTKISKTVSVSWVIDLNINFINQYKYELKDGNMYSIKNNCSEFYVVMKKDI